MAEIREISVEIDVRSVRKTFSYRLTPRSKKRRKKKTCERKTKKEKKENVSMIHLVEETNIRVADRVTWTRS